MFKHFSGLNEVKQDITEISNYIKGSANRLASFFHIQHLINPKENPKRIVQHNEIRWSSFYQSLHFVLIKYYTIKQFFEEEYKKEKIEKLKRIFYLMNNSSFIEKIVWLDFILFEINKLFINLQFQDLDIEEVRNLIKSLFTNLEKIKSTLLIKNILIRINEMIEMKLDLKSSNEIEKNVNEVIDFIILHVKKKFNDENSTIQKILKFFDINELKRCIDGSSDLINEFQYLINLFKPLFSKISYDDTEKDFNLFIKKISSSISKFKTRRELCEYILKCSTFGNCITLQKLSQIFLIIAPTTVSVEGGFSIINNIKDKRRNKLSENTINMLMMVKMNNSSESVEELTNKCSKNWLEMKKNRKLQNFYWLLELEMQLIEKNQLMKPMILERMKKSMKILD
jgi:hypothetical protein